MRVWSFDHHKTSYNTEYFMPDIKPIIPNVVEADGFAGWINGENNPDTRQDPARWAAKELYQ